MIGVIPHQGRHVEGDREPLLAVLEQVVEALVGLLDGAEAGELAHRPEAAPVHRLVWPPGERELAGVAEALPGVGGAVLGAVEGLHRVPGEGAEISVALEGAGLDRHWRSVVRGPDEPGAAQAKRRPTGILPPERRGPAPHARGPEADQAGQKRGRGDPEAPPEALEAHHRPALAPCDLSQRRIRVDGDRMADGAHHRQVRGRVRVGVGGAKVDPVAGGERLHRLDLALAVDEGAVEAAGEAAVPVDLVAGPDPALHPEHPSQGRDDPVAGGADDEARPPGVGVGVDLGQHLRVDARQDPGQHLGPHAIDLDARHSGDQIARDLHHLGSLLVARPTQPVAEVIEAPAGELAAPDDPPLRGHPGEDHPRRPRHQGLVEVEEGGRILRPRGNARHLLRGSVSDR